MALHEVVFAASVLGSKRSSTKKVKMLGAAACFSIALQCLLGPADAVSLQADPRTGSQTPIASLFDATEQNIHKGDSIATLGPGLGPSIKQRGDRDDAPSLMRSEADHHDGTEASGNDDDADDDKKDPRPWLTRSHSLSIKHHTNHKGDVVGADDESENAPDPNAEAPARAAASTPAPAATATATSPAPAAAAPATAPAPTAQPATQSPGSGFPPLPSSGGQQAGALLLLLAVLVSLLALVLAVTALIVAIRYRNSGSAIFEDYGLLGGRRTAGANSANYRRGSASALWPQGTPHQSLLPSSHSSSQQSLPGGRIPTTELLLPKPMGRPGGGGGGGGRFPNSSDDDEAISSDGLWGAAGDPRGSRKSREKPLD
mmetsp:Transcript_23290/g.51147  ORF Transcript_23290/g.51147 Transcript_23290/m.51147 type:complete len:373 (+) Transcript_23290:372-1490(+)